MTAPTNVEQGRRVELPSSKPPGTAQRGFGTTLRIDRWILSPAAVGIAFTAFIVWSLISSLLLIPGAFFDVPYYVDGYLSPFFSPLIILDFLPIWFSPAILILWIPLGFRASCYYYRKAYYRSFFFDPPACAVGEPSVHKRYGMENAFPWILNNSHRFFLYLAFIPLVFLGYEAIVSVHHDGHWRLGLGTLVLAGNVVLLGAFTFSCNSLRHLIGGNLDCYSCTASRRTRHGLWKRVTGLNTNHAVWAWLSLGSVVLADIYVRLLALDVIDDLAIVF